MWKRILVLVLFLFGVFWWLSNRDVNPDDLALNPDNEAEVSVETEEPTETDEEPVEADEETATTEQTEEADKTGENTTEAKETETVSTTTTVTTTTEAEVEATPVVVKPVVEVVTKPVDTGVVTDAKVYLYEWGLDLSQKTFPVGVVNFAVQNDGRFTHDFSIRGVADLGKVTPGTTETFTVQLGAGEYEVYSNRREDYERGVRDMITVQ